MGNGWEVKEVQTREKPVETGRAERGKGVKHFQTTRTEAGSLGERSSVGKVTLRNERKDSKRSFFRAGAKATAK